MTELKLERRAQQNAERRWQEFEAEQIAKVRELEEASLGPLKAKLSEVRSAGLHILNERTEAARIAYELEVAAASAEYRKLLAEPEQMVRQAQRQTDEIVNKAAAELRYKKAEWIEDWKQQWLRGYDSGYDAASA